MPTGLLVLCIVVLGVFGWLVAVARTRALSRSGVKTHSRPGYYGFYVVIWTMLPAMAVLAIWLASEPLVVSGLVRGSMPEAVGSQSESRRSLIGNEVNAVANGLRRLSAEEIADARAGRVVLSEILAERGIPLASAPRPFMVDAAVLKNSLEDRSGLLRTIVVLGLGVLGLGGGLMQVRPDLRARNGVEKVMLAGLAAASSVAIVTTVGIVLSMLFETIHFFRMVPPGEFFFGTVWDPRFSAAGATGDAGGQFGLLPLLWGTLYISIVALAIAVPVGLFAAIYMSEYAGPKVRASAKPLLELLAGIPTIVYGFFALITFGPFLRDIGEAVGLSISATSVLTAGMIMGVMLIPFVSSLSDDIINSVPQTLRDGSYALGSTKSETIKLVILPAALPGIVGAILLAASRAIGETMIVVLAAGIAANLTLNPFQPVTTMTVKIVSQLTGDLEFNSPQTLVAFALGLTLFAFTLVLNIYALYIVRKYREQYE